MAKILDVLCDCIIYGTRGAMIIGFVFVLIWFALNNRVDVVIHSVLEFILVITFIVSVGFFTIQIEKYLRKKR